METTADPFGRFQSLLPSGPWHPAAKLFSGGTVCPLGDCMAWSNTVHLLHVSAGKLSDVASVSTYLPYDPN